MNRRQSDLMVNDYTYIFSIPDRILRLRSVDNYFNDCISRSQSIPRSHGLTKISNNVTSTSCHCIPARVNASGIRNQTISEFCMYSQNSESHHIKSSKLSHRLRHNTNRITVNSIPVTRNSITQTDPNTLGQPSIACHEDEVIQPPPYNAVLGRRSFARRCNRQASRSNLDGWRRMQPATERQSRLQPPTRIFLRSSNPSDETNQKKCCTRNCCIQFFITITTFRWMLLFVLAVAVGCIIAGIILASVHISFGSSFLTMSIMFLVLGILLVVVFSIGWKCTPMGHEPCHLLFNMSRSVHLQHSRLHQRRRDIDCNQWFGGALYPEFEYQPPPPSYVDSLHDCLDPTSVRQQTPPPPYLNQSTIASQPQSAQIPLDTSSEIIDVGTSLPCNNLSNLNIQVHKSEKLEDSEVLQDIILDLPKFILNQKSMVLADYTVHI